MFLSNNSSSTSSINLDHTMIRFFIICIALLIVFISFTLILTPAFAADNSKKVTQTKKNEGFFDKVVSVFKAPVAIAQNNQAKPTLKPAIKEQTNFFQQIWNFITAPFKALVKPSASSKPTTTPTKTTKATPASTIVPTPVSEEDTVSQPAPTPAPTPALTTQSQAPVNFVVTSLNKGVTFVDLIGTTIIDSNGKIYPANSGLALSEKPSLGTSTNKFYGLFVRDFEVSKDGDVIARGKVTLGDEGGDTIKFVGKIGTDIVPSSTNTLKIGTADLAFLSANISTVNSSTVNTGTINVSTVKLDDGSASSPALQFTSDSDSGLWRIGANRVALTTGSSAVSGITVDGSGNLGIGITTPNSVLSVRGGAAIGTGFGSMTAPTSGLLVEGSVGIGISVPSQTFQIGTGGSSLVFTSGGNLGVGITTPLNTLHLIGTVRVNGSVGSDTFGITSSSRVGVGTTAPGGTFSVSGNTTLGTFSSTAGPTNGLAVSGNVGIGVTTANSALAVVGGGVFGSGYAGMTAPTDGLLVQGRLGIGTTTPVSAFQVNSGASSTVINASGNLGIGTTNPNSAFSLVGGGVIGTGYGSLIAPTSGLLVEGRVGIGTTAPVSALSVSGNLGVGGTSAGAAYNLEIWGTGRLTGALTVDGNLGVGASITSDSAARLNTLRVTGFSDLASNVGVGASITVNGNIYTPLGLRVGGFSDLAGNLGVGSSALINGLTTSLGGIRVNGFSDLTGNVGVGSSLTTNGLEVALGGIRVNGFSDLTGNVGVGGSLTVTSLSRFSSSILGIAGSATAPSFSFIDDTDSGLFNPSANALGLTTNGASRFTVTQAGFVGIGITSPAQTFQVNSGASSTVINASGNLGIGTTNPNSAFSLVGGGVIGTGYGSLIAPTSGLLVEGRVGIGTTAPGAALGVSGAGLFGTYANLTGPTNGLAVSGNVGAGTTTPSAALHAIGTTTAFAGLFEGGNVGIGTSAPATLLTVGSTLTSQVRIASSGNVGIGVTTPTPLAPLHVSGNGALTAIFLGGNVGIGTTATGFNMLQVQGTVGIGTTDPAGSYKLDVAGTVRAVGYFGRCGTGTDATSCNQDVAEIYDAAEDMEPGDLVAIDSVNSKQVRKPQGTYDAKLMGIVSTSPGLLLGINGQDVALGAEASDYPQNADPRKPAVALSGKVPVKVIGPIRSGDYLTASNISGVAMKATKGGAVVGQALEDYNGEGVGKVLAFVRVGYFNGVKIVEMVAQDALEGLTANFSQLVLAKLLAEREALAADSASELLTDRIAAGVEVITPQLTADNVATGLIRPLDEGNLTLALTSTQAFNITNENNESVISFDSQGNAYFKGRVVAAAVKADQIEGLRVLADALITSRISALIDQKLTPAEGSVAGVSTDADTLDVTALVKFNADGGLTVGGPAEFKGQSIFAAAAEFISSVVFKGDVNFLGRIFLPKDSTGVAVIKSGSDAVTVSFERGYGSAPSVNVTQTNYSGNDGAGNSILTGDVRFVVQGLSGSGFTIKLNRAAPADMIFSWTALAQNNQFVGTAPASNPVQATPAPSAIPAPSVEPTPAPSAEPEPTPTPSPSSEPAAEASASGSLTVTP